MTDHDTELDELDEVPDPREVRARGGQPKKKKGWDSDSAKLAAQRSAEVRRAKAEARARGELVDLPKAPESESPAFVSELRKQFEDQPELLARAALESASAGKASSGISQLYELAYGAKLEDVAIPRTEARIRAMSSEERRALLFTLERKGHRIEDIESIDTAEHSLEPVDR